MLKEFNDNKLVIMCPRCGNRLLRSGDADIEVVCSNNKCLTKWNISIKGWNVHYEHADNKVSKTA